MRKPDAIYFLPMVLRQADLRRVWCRGKKTITPAQRVWTRYMLTLWGRHLGGDDSPAGCVNVIGRLMIRTEWSEGQSNRIVEVVEALHSQGYRGEELFRRSRELVIPGTSASSIIALAKESDDAAFVETVMSKAIKRDSPIRSVAIKRYCDRKCPQDIARMIERETGADVQASRKRVIWCEEILEEEMFYAIKREMEKEFLLNAA
ncbi:Uncharacterised protein [Serratia ficaria]|uniref:hypothetical protein n=1 Tax=Serratia ficaria TaxID=61651 RepID=UPI00217A3E2D|nr:hypothetical protein [Serratia ficaria]CAI1230802.1 Uncharacterised protein [Serratia ficaria]CAI1769143.1 Uncharacterised protein [Serratia ficaria]CAI2464651.1 Uncharacterised protein [Serratia ficaria]